MTLPSHMGTDLFWDYCWVYWIGVWIKHLSDASKSIKDRCGFLLVLISWDEEHLPLLSSSVVIRFERRPGLVGW